MENKVNPSTTYTVQLQKFQQRLGYQFADDTGLRRALTHKSYSKTNNERLEFIGDAVLGYVVGHLLFVRYPNAQEDALSLMRSALVRGKTLAEVAVEIDLAPVLKLGEGELKSGGRQRQSILADAFEAVLGAVHEDGGIEACIGIIETLFLQRITHINDHELRDLKDPKTQLQEYLQGRKLPLPDYVVADVSGEDHQRVYTVACVVDALGERCTATAQSRRVAEKAAAAKMLDQISKP